MYSIKGGYNIKSFIGCFIIKNIYLLIFIKTTVFHLKTKIIFQFVPSINPDEN